MRTTFLVLGFIILTPACKSRDGAEAELESANNTQTLNRNADGTYNVTCRDGSTEQNISPTIYAAGLYCVSNTLEIAVSDTQMSPLDGSARVRLKQNLKRLLTSPTYKTTCLPSDRITKAKGGLDQIYDPTFGYDKTNAKFYAYSNGEWRKISIASLWTFQTQLFAGPYSSSGYDVIGIKGILPNAVSPGDLIVVRPNPIEMYFETLGWIASVGPSSWASSRLGNDLVVVQIYNGRVKENGFIKVKDGPPGCE